MAYTQVQTLVDTDRRHVTKRINLGTAETDALVVNAASLAFATVTLTTGASANNFKVGETINAASGGSAVVQDVINSTSIVVISKTGTFTGGTTLTGATSGRTRSFTSNSASTYVLNVSKIIFSVGGNSAAAKVELMWEGNGGGANNRTIAILSGQDKFELDAYAMRSNNTANNATGNITLNTLNFGTDCHYTVLLDVSKVSGYAPPFFDRNALGAY